MKKIVLNEQNFALLREKNGIYVDKTQRIYEMIEYSSYLFLSRPRRFGKSLLVSTLEALYQGKKELFNGLWIQDKWKWEEYPIIRLDFSDISAGADMTLKDISNSIKSILKKYVFQYNIADKIEIDKLVVSSVLRQLIQELYQKTGKRVVLLIDEYDNPITSHIAKPEIAERNRDYFRDIYKVIKSSSGMLELVFMTGITKFAKMSIFSAISQMKDISLLSPFNDIVGFTHQELQYNFAEHLQVFATTNQMTLEETIEYITKWYDGYTWNGEQHLFNPYAILNALADKMLDTYWFETGTPTFLIQLATQDQTFKNTNAPILQQLDELPASKDTFESYDLKNINLTAALFQSGYLTIKEKKVRKRLINYILGFPNYEVKHAFNAHLLKAFLYKDIAADIKGRTISLLEALETCNKIALQQIITSIFAGIPSSNLKKINEYGYQAMFYQLLLLLGINDIFLEVAGYIGRADGVLLLEEKVFIFECKFARQGTMQYLLNKASEQAQLKGYWHPYLNTDKEIYRVALGFLYKKTAESQTEVLTIDTAWKQITSAEDYL